MKEIKEIANKIQKVGGRIYLVGGGVRDKLLEKDVKDYDYCITGLSQSEFEDIFPEAHIRGKSFAVYDLEGKEFALARKERKSGKGHKQFIIQTDKNISIEEDLARRDITINSIAQDVLTEEIIDPFNGREDVKKGIIRATTKAFAEDPLRVYRVARFSATLGFKVEKNTIKQMESLKKELQSLSKERVFVEFKKALASNMPSAFFNVLKNADVLDVHFKEIFDLIGKIQPEKYHPEGDSYNHTMIVVDNSVLLTTDLAVRFSCLVHDLGKGTTPLEVLPHHYGHEERGEVLVGKLSNRICAPKSWIKCGKVAAKEHMRGGKFNEMTPKKQLDFLERVSKSKLGLDGMKIVVMCDKKRNGEFPNDIVFNEVGQRCFAEINGKYIMKKYNLKQGIELNKKMHEQRIKWIKNNL